MRTGLLAAAGVLMLSPAAFCQGPTVRIETSQGNIDVLLLSNSAPQTVANFLNYVSKGAYNNTFFHRAVANFIIQAGGFQFVNGETKEIPADPPVVNEFSVSNTRGTIAMAKLDGNPNSATNQWFFNLSNNNAQNLDNQNGGFTVFGRIVDEAGLGVMAKIAGLPIITTFSSPFNEIPLANYTGGQLAEANLVMVKSITVLDAQSAPAIASNGIVSATSFGGWSYFAPGSFIEIYGTDLAANTRGWETRDFQFGRAPTSLDGVSVTIADGIETFRAYPSFISPTQLNVQLPGALRPNRTYRLVVTTRGQASEPVDITARARAGGLLAPLSFNVNGKQYVVAAKSDGSLVSNGEVPGVPAAPATSGETLVFYGTGFGAVNPTTFPIAGQVVTGNVTVSTPVEFFIGDVAAQVGFAGLIQGLVGVYQFNVTLPTNLPAGDLPVRVVVGGETIPQTLFLPVR